MRILLFLLLTSGLVPASAQEVPPATEEETVQEEKAVDDPDIKKSSEVETPDTFDPTEKLSEDFPVAFPVDI